MPYGWHEPTAGSVVGEVAAVLDDLAELEVQRLDRVRRVDHSTDVGRECQERDELLPGVLERRDRVRVPLTEFGGFELFELGLGCVGTNSPVDRFQRSRDGFAVLVPSWASLVSETESNQVILFDDRGWSRMNVWSLPLS